MNRSPGELRQNLTIEGDRRAQAQSSPSPGSSGAPITKLILVVIHSQDQRKTLNALETLGVQAFEFPSTGVFLARENETLLVPTPEAKLPAVLKSLAETCHRRVAYISTNIEAAVIPAPLTTPIPVGGAIVFTLDLERFEEF